MCVTLYKYFKCGCTEAKSIEPCPKMEKALDLVDLHGVAEGDARIQKLEDECIEKSATRYDVQSGYCDLCNASIAAVGMRIWLAAKMKRDSDAEDKLLDDLECEDAAADAATRRMRSIRKPARRYGLVYEGSENYETGGSTSTSSFRTIKRASLPRGKNSTGFLPGDRVSGFSASTIQQGKAKVPQIGHNFMDYLDNENDIPNAAELRLALAAVLEARADLDDHYVNEDIVRIEDSEDSEGSEDTRDDDERASKVSNTDGSLFRSRAPSPGIAGIIDTLGLNTRNKGKGRQC